MSFRTPRPDQERAITALFDFYAVGQTRDRNPLIGMPTGYGKSLVIAEFARRMFHYFPHTRLVIATHVKELIEQNAKTLLDQWPTAPVGICSAGLKQRDTMHPIIIGGIKSLINSSPAIGFRHLMIVDEAHLVSPHAETQYRKFIAYMKGINPYFTVPGLSATLYRTGSGPLTEAEGGLFTDVIFDCTSLHEFNRILDEGWLCRLIPKPTATELSIDGVGWSGDDYNQSDAQAAVDKADITIACVRETIGQKLAYGRRSCLIFSQGVEHAEHIAECLMLLGHNAATITDKTPDAVRAEHIASFKNGTLPYLVNNNVLTTGFDFPGLDMISVMRLIGSPGLWVQILGRGTRPEYAPYMPLDTPEQRQAAIAASRKPNCLVLDFAGNTKRLGPINDPVIPKKRGKRVTPGVAPIKICPICGVYNHASARRCDGCDVEFSREQKLQALASEDELIRSSEPRFETHIVDTVEYTKYVKHDSKPVMKVSYREGLLHVAHNEYLAFEHNGWGRKKAVAWWLAHSSSPIPATTDEALQQIRYLKEPVKIELRVDLPHPEITRYIWPEEDHV